MMRIYKKFLLTVACFGSFMLLQTRLDAQIETGNTNNNKSKSTVISYPAIDSLTTSPDFTVKANNTPIWTESVGNGGMENLNVANYSCAGTQTITIKAPEN